MTLREWADKQPLKVQRHKKYFNAFHVPDALELVDRSEAWHLSDYAVSSVLGGTIWFIPRSPIAEVTR